MQQMIKYDPSFSLLQLSLSPGEVLVAEAGSMVARTTALTMEVKLNAGKNAGFFGKIYIFSSALSSYDTPRGASLTYNDPHVPKLPRMRHHPSLPVMESMPLTPEFLAAQDCVLIATDHSSYDYADIVRHAPLVLDTRNATSRVTEGREKIRKA